jgi:TP901 family phage tail tape measure protein
VTTTSLDVVVRMRNARAFQRDVIKSGAELEAMGLKGANALTKFAAKADRLKSFGKDWSRHVTLPILGLGALAGKVAIDFDKSMRNINSIAQLPEKQFQKLGDSVLGLAKDTAQSPKVLADGLYDLVSSGFKAKDAMNVLEASARAATAGLTTTDVSAKTVSAVLNAYKLPASQAQHVSDLLFQTVNRGVTSFEQLSTSLGYVLPAAASLGIGLDQVGASISTLTKEGQSPETAITNLNQAMTSLFKPTTAMSKAIKDLGYENSQALVKAKGFQGAIEAVVGATDGSQESIGKLFGNVRAIRAVLGLTGKNARGAAKDLKAFGDVSGATDTALSQQSKSVSYKWNQLKAEFSALAVKVAPRFLDAGKKIIGVLADIGDWFAKLSSGTQSTIINFLLLAAAIGPVTTLLGFFGKGIGRIIIFLPKLIAFTQGFLALRAGVGTITALNIALAGFGLTLRGLLMTTGIGAAIAAIYLLNKKFHFLGPTIEWLKGAFGSIKNAAVIAFNSIKKVVTDVFSWVKSHWKLLTWILLGPFQPVVVWIVNHFGQIVDFFKEMPGKIKNALVGVWDAITGPFRGPFNWVVDKIRWIIGKIGEAIDKVNDLASKAGDVGDFVVPGGGHGLFSDQGVLGIGGIPGLAGGGTVIRGGTTVVGEAGPELLDLPKGSSVIPLNKPSATAGHGKKLLRIEVPVFMDRRKVAEGVVDEIDLAEALG